MKKLLIVYVLLLMAKPLTASAQAWVFVRDDNSENINSTDTIVGTLASSRVKVRDKTFLTNVSEVGIVLQATLNGFTTEKPNQKKPQQATFPLGYKAPVLNRQKGKDVIDLPFENIFITSLKLSDSTTQYNNLQMNVSLVKVDEASAWGKITSKLIGFANAANIPASPYSTTAKYILDFANSSVTDALSSVGKDTNIPLGQRAVSFLVTPHPKTGSYLLLDNPSSVGKGYIDPNDLSGHCFYLYTHGGTSTINVGNTSGGQQGESKDIAGCYGSTYVQLQNPYIRILIQKEDVPPGETRPASGNASFTFDIPVHDKYAAIRSKRLEQCDQAGIHADHCLAAKILK